MVCCIEADSKTLSVRWGGGGKGKKRRIITAYFLSCACYPRFRSFYPKDYIVFCILMLYLLVWRSIIDIIIYIYCMYVYARARMCVTEMRTVYKKLVIVNTCFWELLLKYSSIMNFSNFEFLKDILD